MFWYKNSNKINIIERNLLDIFSQQMKEKGLAGIKNIYSMQVMDPDAFIHSIANIIHGFNYIVDTVFSNDLKYMHATDNACSYIINFDYQPVADKKYRVDTILLNFYNNVISKSSKTKDGKKTEHELDMSMLIWKYIFNKNGFMEEHKRQMFYRLTVNDLCCVDYEEYLIQLFDNEYVSGTIVLCKMLIKDVYNSIKINEQFLQYMTDKTTTNEFEFTAKVFMAECGSSALFLWR